MSKETTYKCDRCGATSTDQKELGLCGVAVGMRTKTYGSYESGFRLDSQRDDLSADWCRRCCEAVGFCDTKEKAEVSGEPDIPSLEDLVREIVREEMS